MKKIILFIFFSLLFTCFTYGQIRWEQIKPISAQLEKSTFNGNDLLLIEDSEASGVRKFIKLSNVISANTVLSTSTFDTDNAVLRADGTSRNAQKSPVVIDDNSNIITTNALIGTAFFAYPGLQQGNQGLTIRSNGTGNVQISSGDDATSKVRLFAGGGGGTPHLEIGSNFIAFRNLIGIGDRLLRTDSNGNVTATITDNSTNWNTAYSNRIATFTTTGSSGPATFIDNTLNIPVYSGGGGVGDIFLTGYVTGRNINILYPDYTPDNGYMLHVLPDSEIPNGTDSISITINGTGARQIYNRFKYTTDDNALELVYAANRWFVLGSKGEDYSVSGKNTGDQDLSGIRDSLYQVWVNQQLNTDIITPQTLVGTSPYWNVNNGRNANITLTGATTITLANLLAGQHGTLSVTNGGSTSYLITFAGYTIKIHDAIRSAANKVVVSGGTATDEFTWYYNGNYVAIRGGLNLW
jgi:hypothetical protein